MSAEITDLPYAGLLDVPRAADGKPGIITDEANYGRRDGDAAMTAPHLMCVGKTGSGKSRTVLAPNCARWGPRALVVMSSKGDLSELTIRRRAQFGTQYVMDLSGEIRGGQIEGVPLIPVRIDPCAWIETDDEAMEMASLLMQIGDVGAGGDGQGSGDSAFWKSLARRRLACLLRAGGFYRDPDTREMTWGGGIEWALEAAENVGPDAAEGNGRGLTQEGLDDAEPDGDEPLDMITPNWKTAYMRAFSVGSRHADSLMAARAMDERQRDSIGINMQVAMGSWAMESTAAPGAKVFNPSMLAGGSTLHIVAGMDGAAPTVVSTVLIEIVRYWRKRVGTLSPVMFVLDEFVNGAQVPARYLNRWISEGRGLGIRLVLGLQSTKQLTRLWGQAAADELRAIMPAALILPGAGETQMLKDAAETTPPEERVVTSLDAGGRASQSRQMVQPTHAELLPPPRSRTDPRISYGRLLLGGQAGVRVRLLDITGTDLA
ncbi:MAG: TraM recognition domain-containing protein [Austwickia sp.]|nr:TraM recognition domain-containing protein [Austwickia sp.]